MQILPVPPLEETVQKFLRWAGPYIKGTEETATAQAAAFAKAAQPLQKALQKKAAQSTTSWLYEDWIASYLAGREPLTLSTNFAVELFPHEEKSLNYLKRFIAALSHLSSLWQTGRYPQETDHRGSPVDMSQFAILGGCSRIAQSKTDRLHFAEKSRHIAIYSQSRLYKLDVLDSQFNVIGTPHLELLADKLEAQEEGLLSSLAYMPGKSAAACRQALSVQEKEYFDVIDNALFAIVLRNEKTTDENAALHRALFLDGACGWPSRSMHFIFNLADSRLWANFEHTYQDAGTLTAILARARSFMRQNIALPPGQRPVLIAEHLTPVQKQQLAAYQTQYRSQAAQIAIKHIEIPIPASLLKKHSADVLSQIAHVYAITKIMQAPRGIYEAAAIPHFRNGRTECVRSYSLEMEELAYALQDNQAQASELIKLFERATAEHKERIKACKKGLGVDRHLLGLQLLAEKQPAPDELSRKALESFFTGNALKAESENFFSTSSLGEIDVAGVLIYNPVMTGGYGVAYGQTASQLIWHLSYAAKQEAEANRIAASLKEAIEKLSELLS